MLIKIIRAMDCKLTLSEDFKDQDFLKIMSKMSIQGIVPGCLQSSHSARKIIKKMLLR